VVNPVRRIVLWASSTAATVVLLFGYHTSTAGVAAPAQQPIGASLATTSTTTTSGTGPDTGTAGSTGSSGSTGTSGSTSASGSSGTVTGDVVQTQWGPVQVQITTDNGQITAVDVVQYPSGNGRDVEINNYALPILVDETLSAQSASIDMVSGATVSSVGYLGSLQSALDQAGL
jgi:uncharacterized protein with FMN-binding domain